MPRKRWLLVIQMEPPLPLERAALMASLLAEQERDPRGTMIYEGAASLFRTQEQTYRSLALFIQAGEQTPAPTGVCQLLSLAENHRTKATKLLAEGTPGPNSDLLDLHRRLTDKTQEWHQMIQELQSDFSCNE